MVRLCRGARFQSQCAASPLGFRNNLVETTATMNWSKARGLQTSLRGWKKSQDEATLVFASANVEAKMQVPKETTAGAIVALWHGQNKHLSEFMRLWGYGKTMESSIWLLAQTARGLKMQLEFAYSKSSRPKMRKVLYSTRCALGLTSFHHMPWCFLKIKSIFPW